MGQTVVVQKSVRSCYSCTGKYKSDLHCDLFWVRESTDVSSHSKLRIHLHDKHMSVGAELLRLEGVSGLLEFRGSALLSTWREVSYPIQGAHRCLLPYLFACHSSTGLKVDPHVLSHNIVMHSV